MFWAATVDEELVVEMGSFVAFRLVLDIDCEILPVRLHKMVPERIHVGVLRSFALSFVPASLVGDPIVGNKAFALVNVLGIVGLLCRIVDGGIGWFVQVGLVVGDEHLHTEINMGVL